jgi:sugar-specific transcriptional regulator TrmB
MVARALGLKRTTVYSALEALESRKLVTRTKRAGSAEFSAAPANEIPTILINQAKGQFEKLLSAVDLIRPRIERFHSPHAFQSGDLSARHIDNSHDYTRLLDKYILSYNFCSVWNPQLAITTQFVEHRVLRFLRLSGKRRNVIKEIVPPGPRTDWYIKNISNPNHEVRFTDFEATGTSDLLIVEDAVVIALNSLDNESALEIKNKHYSDFMRWYFKSLWARLQP